MKNNTKQIKSTTDFLNSKKKGKKSKKALSISLSIIGVIVIALLGAFLYYRVPALAMYHNASAGKESFTKAQQDLRNQDYDTAKQSLEDAVKSFEDAQKNVDDMGALKVIPFIATQMTAVDNLLHAGSQTGKAAISLTLLAKDITAPINSKTATLATIPPEQKREMLQRISESEPELQGVKADLDLAMLYFDRIPKKGLVGPLAKAIEPLREQLPALHDGITQALPAVRVVPEILGYPSQQEYLFLLQNNSELRPTGGFIGTYGIVRVKDGEIGSFFTDNIYNLDVPSEDFLHVDPPKPLQKYLNSTRWFLRDANWSPDFPTTAQKALEFYDLEKQSKQHLQGVIAVTPTVIETLIALTGDITVEGITFTKDNFVDVLEDQVGRGFLRQGIPEPERKEIIGSLSDILFDRLLSLPSSRWGEIATAFTDSIKEKQILVWLDDADAQAIVTDQGWSGEVKQNDGDYVMVVDANMASLKTDPNIHRDISYSIEENNGTLEAHLTMHYLNKGEFDWKTTRYRTYTRIYIPEGSTLVRSDGYLQDDKLKGAKHAEPEVSTELGKTVISGFISIEPQEEGQLTLVYTLPESISNAWKEGNYSLLVQKQPGTIAHGLKLDIPAKKRLQSYSPAEGAEQGGGHIRWTTNLQFDREFTMDF